MNWVVLLPRPKLGSKTCKLLKAARFIPGTVRLRAHTTPISVCSNSVKRSAYKQSVCALLGGQVVTLKLLRYQLDPVSFEIQHVEYQQCERTLASTLTRVLVFNATGCAAVKSGAEFKLLRTKLDLIGETSFAPNYVKVDMSECISGDDIVVTHLCYKQARFVTTEWRCVLATVR